MMTPSRIRSSGGAADYYSADDYYLEGEAGAPGIAWGGKGAEDLGLSGTATKEELQAVLEGRNPDPEGPSLVASEGKAKHHPGWDFTFAVPKSVTLAIIAADRFDPELADRLRGHVMAANAEMMGYLEENHAITRVRDEGGQIRQVLTGNLVYGSVMHITTRGGDPHIHVHNPIANITKNPETGEYGALETQKMFKWQKNTSLIGARSLQAAMMQEGFDVRSTGDLAWEVVGVDPRLTKEFSTRSEEINERAKALADERGIDQISDAQRTMIQKQTRKAKEHVERQAIADEWYGRAESAAPGALEATIKGKLKKLGRDVTSQVEGAMSRTESTIRLALRTVTGANKTTHHFGLSDKGDPDRQAQDLVAYGVRIVDSQEAVNSKHLMMQHALLKSPLGFTYGRLEASFNRMVEKGLVLHADARMIGGVTTSASVEREQFILAAIDNGRGKGARFIPEPILAEKLGTRALAERMGRPDFRLGDEQHAGAVKFFGTADRYSAIQGFAGVGKSTLFGAVKAVADSEGIRLHGISTQHSFVRELKSVGLTAQTIESFLREKEQAIETGGAVAARERAAWNKAYLVIDEASTISNATAVRIARVVDELKIPGVRIAGDQKQLGGMGSGNPFKLMLDRKIDQTEIKTIVRQRNAAPHFQAAAKHFAEGKVREGLTAMAPNIHELGKSATDIEIANKVVELWKGATGPGTTGIVVATNKMRDLVAHGVRAELRSAGVLKGPDLEVTRYYQKRLPSAAQFNSKSYAIDDVIVPTSAFSGRETPRAPPERVVGLDHANNLLKVQNHLGKTRLIDLNAEHERRSATFSAFTERSMPVAEGERLVWEARFKDRGYELGGGFTIKRVTKTSWTIVHDQGEGKNSGKEETLSIKDPALNYAGYAYAQTANRAQGQTIGKVIYELTTKAGEAANEARNYVMNSRMSHSAQMVTDDLAKLATMLMSNDGQKPVALDHLRGVLDTIKAEQEAEKAKPPPTPEKEKMKTMDMGSPGEAHEKTKTRTKSIDQIGPIGMGGI